MPTKKPTPKPISLNEEQRAVANLRSGRFKVEAGPGSGKSQTLLVRWADLLREGIPADNILNLTFTKTAAKNLRDRVEGLVGPLTIDRKGAGAVTFHSWALTFSQEERDAFPFELQEFPLCPEPLAARLSGASARRFEVDPRTLRSWISLRRRSRTSPSEAVRHAESAGHGSEVKLALAYKDYEKRCREEGVLTFDDLIYHAVDILEKKPEIRQRWIRDWQQVDEAQDLAKIEWDLARLIAGKSLVCVGDCSQGLYSFRGGDSALFANMHEMFPGTQTLFLSHNYRSSKSIVDFIRPYAATPELAQRFHTDNEVGVAPRIVGFNSAMEEAAYIVKQIQESI